VGQGRIHVRPGLHIAPLESGQARKGAWVYRGKQVRNTGTPLLRQHEVEQDELVAAVDEFLLHAFRRRRKPKRFLGLPRVKDEVAPGCSLTMRGPDDEIVKQG